MAKFKLPRDTATCTFEIPKGTKGQTAEHKMMDNQAEWSIKKFTGGQEHTLITRITLKSDKAQ